VGIAFGRDGKLYVSSDSSREVSFARFFSGCNDVLGLMVLGAVQLFVIEKK
jgi:hypothetical protein